MWRVALLLAGCSVLPGFRATEKDWHEITSEHFVMWTDANATQAQQTLVQMEHQRAVVLGVAFPNTVTQQRVLVVAFDGKKETAYFMPQNAAAFTSFQNELGKTIIVMVADAAARHARVLTHELTHAITFQFIRHQPVWFAEGIASYFETVNRDPNSSDVRVGDPSPDRTRYAKSGRMDSVARAFACVAAACRTGEFYATSWAILTYLMNEHPVELARYEQALMETAAAGKEIPSWESIVPEWPADKLDSAIRDWLVEGRHTVRLYKLRLQTWPTTVAPLSEANAHAIEGAILGGRRPDESKDEIATALRLDPLNMIANLTLAETAHKTNVDTARLLVGANPGDWRAWNLLAHASSGEEQEGARSEVCWLLAKDPSADPPLDLKCTR